MNPELIVMLTHHDQTVGNALEIFRSVADLPITNWGFKDVGLPPEEIKALVREIKNAGKITYLEVVSLSEEEGLRGAELAVEGGFDILMGTVYFDTINEFLKGQPVKYYPFPGHVHGHPSILEGAIDEIVAHARFLQSRGVDGLDLLTYRYTGDAPALLKAVVQAVQIPVVSAGSIASRDRILEVKRAGAWGFTIGSAFFEARFVEGGSFRDNLLAVWSYLQQLEG